MKKKKDQKKENMEPLSAHRVIQSFVFSSNSITGVGTSNCKLLKMCYVPCKHKFTCILLITLKFDTVVPTLQIKRLRIPKDN